MTADPRELSGRLVHETRLAHEAERAEAEGRVRFLLGTWEERSDDQHELDMRIGEAVAAAERERDAKDRAAAEANIARLGIHVDRLAKEHARHSLAVSAHKARADQQESRAVRAEKQLVRFALHAGEYGQLAEQAAESQRNADLVAELRKHVTALEGSLERARAAERIRIRQGILGIETVLERPATGESVVAVETMALEALIGIDDHG
jgi:hypothetical protein